MGVLIRAQALRELLDGAPPPVVLDVRGALGVVDPVGDHEAAHIPGSRYVDLETELSGPHDPGAGRHPLPDPDVFAGHRHRVGRRAGHRRRRVRRQRWR